MTNIADFTEVVGLALLIGGPAATAASAWYAVKYALKGITVLVERHDKTLYHGNGEVALVEQVHDHTENLARLEALAERNAADINALREANVRFHVERDVCLCPLKAERAARELSGERRPHRRPSGDRPSNPRRRPGSRG